MMHLISENLNDVLESIQKVTLKRRFPSEVKLISLDITSIVDEYCNFIHALISCRKVAEEEYSKITNEMRNISLLRDKVTRLQNELSNIMIIDNVQLDENNMESQAACSNALNNTMTTFSSNFLKTIDEIEQHISKEVDDLKKFKVVLFGRTKVGKSTVREALTQGNGDSIGKGGQSTTKENHEYNWYNLQIYDTPGILSTKDTNVDSNGLGDEERKAREILKRSDIAIFMFATDNIETVELDYLRDIASTGKEILVLLNVKSDISDYRMYKLRKKSRELNPEAQSGHINRIKSAVDTDISLLPIHAQAAFFSRAHNNGTVDAFYEKYDVTRDELYELSHFGEIRNFLVNNILSKGTRIRCQTLWNYFISQIRDFAILNRKPVEICKDQLIRTQTQILRADAKFEKLFSSYESSMEDKVLRLAQDRVDTYDYASDCIYGGYSKDSIRNGWESKLETLSDIHQVIIKELMDEVQIITTELKQNLDFEINSINNFDGYENEMDLSGLLKGAGIVSGLAAAGLAVYSAFAAANAWHPGGWLLIGLGVIGALFSWLGGLFKSKTTKIRELNEKLNDSLNAVCKNIAEQITEYMQKNIFSLLREKMNIMKSSQNNMITLCDDFLLLNDSLQAQAEKHEKYLAKRLKDFQ